MGALIQLDYLQCDVEKFSDEKFYKESQTRVASLVQALRDLDTFYLCAECRPLFQLRRNDIIDLLTKSQNLASFAHYHSSTNYDND